MKSARGTVPYTAFGELLVRLRVGAGYVNQQELASALGITRQIINRWEKGISRPRVGKISALEQQVGAKNNELLVAAGYLVEHVDADFQNATSYAHPLPLMALLPETFESFCAALLHRMYQRCDGTVQRYGGAGHKQHGIDIFATGPFGTHSFQCKRVNDFGPQMVHTAVAKQTFKACLKVLLLSSVASPNSRDAMASHD